MSLNQSEPLHPSIEDGSLKKGYHDLTRDVAFTFSPGTVVPHTAREVLPQDEMTYGFSGTLESFPMLAPCLKGFKHRTVTTFSPLSNFYGYLDNNAKQSTSDFINKGSFWRGIPCTVLPYDAELEYYPTAVPETRPVPGAWMSPSVAHSLYRDGIAPGSLMNALGVPPGYSARYLDGTNNWHDREKNDLGIVYPDLQYLAINFHKLFAYLDSYRTTLANLQENYAYYIGITTVNDGFVYGVDGTPYENDDPTAAMNFRRFDYGYKPITIQSMDSFMMFLRYYTSSPSYGPDGTALSLDLYDPDAFVKFVSTCYNYQLNYAGKPTTQPAIGDAVSALRWFLEVTGLCTCCYGSGLSFLENLFPSPVYLNDSAPALGLGLKAACYTARCENCGYFLGTYDMDLNRGLLSTSVGTVRSTIPTGGFSIDTFRYANSLQKLIDKFDVSGGRFSGWLRRVWKVRPSRDLDCAQLLHVSSSYIGNTDILSTAATDGAALAQQAGYTIGRTGDGEDHFKSDTYGIFLQYSVLVPQVTYEAAVDPSDLRVDFGDCFFPDMANLGFDDVRLIELTSHASTLPVDGSDSANNSGTIPTLVVGRRAAWQDYRTAVDRVFGRFTSASNLSYWTLLRYYDQTRVVSSALSATDAPDPTITDARYGLTYRFVPNSLNTSTYIWPRNYNFLFAQTDDSAQNFRMVAVSKYKGSRAVPEASMPSL